MKNLSDMLCSTLLLFCFLSSSKVDAWGGLFNRFNPSMLSDLGYGGGSYGKELYSAAHSGVSLLECIRSSLIKSSLKSKQKSRFSLNFYFISFRLLQMQLITVQMKNQKLEVMVARVKCALLMNIVVTNMSVQMLMKVSLLGYNDIFVLLVRFDRFEVTY